MEMIFRYFCLKLHMHLVDNASEKLYSQQLGHKTQGSSWVVTSNSPGYHILDSILDHLCKQVHAQVLDFNQDFVLLFYLWW